MRSVLDSAMNKAKKEIEGTAYASFSSTRVNKMKIKHTKGPLVSKS